MDAIKTYEQIVVAITEALLDEAFKFTPEEAATRKPMGTHTDTAKEDPVAAFHALFAK